MSQGAGESVAPGPRGITLETPEFEALRKLIYAQCGIRLNDRKRVLAESRLLKRLRALNLDSFGEYLQVLNAGGSGSDEMREMINCITTNKTSFFRESHHFDILRDQVIPGLVEKARRTGTKRIRIWSSACSKGHEPYTIAITVMDALGSMAGWDVKILGTDIDTQVIAEAQHGIYSLSDVEDVPPELRRLAFDKIDDGTFQVRKAVRDLVTFRRLNLIEPLWPVRTLFDVVFCRNVAIYFDQPTQQQLFTRLAAQTEEDGFLFVGHSENLHWLSNVVRSIGNTVYQPVSRGGEKPRPMSIRPGSIRPRPLTTRAPSIRPRAFTMRAPSIAVRAPALKPRTATIHAPRLTSAVPSVGTTPVRDVAIQAGGVHVAATPTLVRTVLGSCVSVCLFDPVARVGGMNHYALPDGDGDKQRPARCGIHAMELLINGLMKLGAQRERFEAKVFGACNVVPGLGGPGGVASRNAEFVLRFLADEEIRIVAQKLGGDLPLTVHFETHTGLARVRTVLPSEREEVVRTERTFQEKLTAAERALVPAKDVTFF